MSDSELGAIMQPEKDRENIRQEREAEVKAEKAERNKPDQDLRKWAIEKSLQAADTFGVSTAQGSEVADAVVAVARTFEAYITEKLPLDT